MITLADGSVIALAKVRSYDRVVHGRPQHVREYVNRKPAAVVPHQGEPAAGTVPDAHGWIPRDKWLEGQRIWVERGEADWLPWHEKWGPDQWRFYTPDGAGGHPPEGRLARRGDGVFGYVSDVAPSGDWQVHASDGKLQLVDPRNGEHVHPDIDMIIHSPVVLPDRKPMGEPGLGNVLKRIIGDKNAPWLIPEDGPVMVDNKLVRRDKARTVGTVIAVADGEAVVDADDGNRYLIRLWDGAVEQVRPLWVLLGDMPAADIIKAMREGPDMMFHRDAWAMGVISLDGATFWHAYKYPEEHYVELKNGAYIYVHLNNTGVPPTWADKDLVADMFNGKDDYLEPDSEGIREQVRQRAQKFLDDQRVIEDPSMMAGHTAALRRLEKEIADGLNGKLDKTQPKGGVQGLTQVVDLNDGDRIVDKSRMGWEEADREVMAYWVSQAIGAGVPAVAEVDHGEIAEQFVDGVLLVHWLADGHSMVKIYNSDEGRLIALLDFLIHNLDRHQANVIVQNGVPVPIDHGIATFGPEHLMARDNPFWDWNQPYWKTQLARLEGFRAVLAAVKPEFERRRRLEWWDNVHANLEFLIAEAAKQQKLVKGPSPIEANILKAASSLGAAQVSIKSLLDTFPDLFAGMKADMPELITQMVEKGYLDFVNTIGGVDYYRLTDQGWAVANALWGANASIV